ncbi:hypothetical protein [Paenibacillus dendritiformis]|uniref:hypothetical protein n=1 Tax=Paenibacillus dendritiformis TaxID=130049 RepID=UPI0015EC19A2|nr:hypothetical protein [Paenibacillus dendritiformis]
MKKSGLWIGALLLSVVVLFTVMNAVNFNAVNFQKDEPAEVLELQSSTPVPQVEERFGVEKDWQQNGKDNLYTTKLLEGELASESNGIIQTDTDCEADAKGISQCHDTRYRNCCLCCRGSSRYLQRHASIYETSMIPN